MPHSHKTPAEMFGRRLRQLRERRGWKQVELAKRAGYEQPTISKIENGVRGDVSISQLFHLAEVLGTSPINLLTPGSPDETIELSPGGRVVSGTEAREWLSGLGTDPLQSFLDQPVDVQRELIRKSAFPRPTLGAWPEVQEEYVNRALERLRQKEGEHGQ
jgi:transcriptional regulator with XRE-family HTH domain